MFGVAGTPIMIVESSSSWDTWGTVGNVAAVLVAGAIGAWAVLVTARRQRRADRNQRGIEAAADLVAAIGAIHLRLAVFRAWYPKLTNRLTQRPSTKTVGELFSGLTQDHAQALRAYHVIATIYRDKPVTVTAGRALEVVNGLWATGKSAERITSDSWTGSLDELSRIQSELRELLNAELE